MMAALIADPQLCPVFMWCRTVDIGAHHACWLVLQVLFMAASVPTTTNTTRTRTTTTGLLIMTSRPRPNFRRSGMNLQVIVWRTRQLRLSDSNDFDMKALAGNLFQAP
jgi:hypothetical protein